MLPFANSLFASVDPQHTQVSLGLIINQTEDKPLHHDHKKTRKQLLWLKRVTGFILCLNSKLWVVRTNIIKYWANFFLKWTACTL